MSIRIIVESDYALFVNPLLKVERVSYDVPTPGALEGLIKSLYWKPAISYVIDKIIVFNPIKFVNIRRNEIKDKVLESKIMQQMRNKSISPQIIALESRTQRSAMVLQNVRYGVEFHFELTGLKSQHEDECQAKHYNIILRRLRNGQTFRQPCMGCREFSVRKIELVDDFEYAQVAPELHGDVDLGYMLYKMKFRDNGIPIDGCWDNPRFSDTADALYYRPHMIDGVIDVARYREVMKC